MAGQFNFLQFSPTCKLITLCFNGGWHVAVVPTAAVGHALKITNYLQSSSIMPIGAKKNANHMPTGAAGSIAACQVLLYCTVVLFINWHVSVTNSQPHAKL